MWSGARIGNGPSRRMMHGRRRRREKRDELILNFTVCSFNVNLGCPVKTLYLDHADSSRRRYKKDLDLLKPDLEAYNRQKAVAMGLGPSALTKGKGLDEGTMEVRYS
jgi:hypothetical protein